MTRVIVFSDVHANYRALSRLLVDQSEAEEFWFLGDLWDRGDLPAPCYERLRSQARLTVWLAGNHDLAAAGDEDFKANMSQQQRRESEGVVQLVGVEAVRDVSARPSQVRCEVAGWRAWLAHGWPDTDPKIAARTYDFDHAPLKTDVHRDSLWSRRQRVDGDSEVWLVGHSHCRSAWVGHPVTGWQELVPGFGTELSGRRRHANGKPAPETVRWERRLGDAGHLLILNPGSLGDPRDGFPADLSGHYLELDFQLQWIDISFRSVHWA